MIVEQRKLLRWITFPESRALRPSLFRVYTQSNKQVDLWTHTCVPFYTYRIDLASTPEIRFAQYSAGLRQNIRRAEKQRLAITRDKNYQPLLNMFQLTIAARQLMPVDTGHFLTKQDYLISTIAHPEHGPLAAHAYSLAPGIHTVKLDYNASAYRRFPARSTARNLCGLANCKLFDADFTYFAERGYTTYDFGGYGKEHGVRHFKDQFGGQVVLQYNYFPTWYYGYRQLRSSYATG